MIKVSFVFLLQLFLGSVMMMGQDTLHLVNNCKILISSLDSGTNVVKYTRFGTDKLREIDKSKLVSVHYKNGSMHLFNTFDTLLLLNGKNILAKTVTTAPERISYRNECNELKSISADRVFSVRHREGKETIIYQKDNSDSLDFTSEQMRLFIRGEQDATKYYKNNVIKVSAFLIGGGGALLGWGGVIVPPIYSTLLGSFSPNMDKQIVSDKALLKSNEYREGYEKKVRDNKIRNSIIYGMVGLVTGATVFTKVFH